MWTIRGRRVPPSPARPLPAPGCPYAEIAHRQLLGSRTSSAPSRGQINDGDAGRPCRIAASTRTYHSAIGPPAARSRPADTGRIARRTGAWGRCATPPDAPAHARHERHQHADRGQPAEDRDDAPRATGDRQRDAAEREERRPEVEQQHRATVRVADLEHAMVQVLLVRGERRLAAPNSPDYGQHEVDEGDG